MKSLENITVYSVGNTPKDAIEALGKKLEWGALDNFEELDGDGYDWGFRFTADTTSMKAAGMNVPGGVILTWWK